MSAFLFRFREPLSAVGTGLVMLLLFHSWVTALPLSSMHVAPVELTVLQEPLPAEQAASHQPEVVPPGRRNVTDNFSQARESTVASKTLPADPVASTAAVSAAAISTAAVLPASTPVQAARAVPVQTIPVAAASTLDSARNAESIYAGRVRAYLQTVKRYPTGREASLQRPAGTSVIWFIVRRNGELVGAGVDASSGFMLLDNAALATVRRGNYPVFSDDAWPGKAQQRFTVELNFMPAQ